MTDRHCFHMPGNTTGKNKDKPIHDFRIRLIVCKEHWPEHIRQETEERVWTKKALNSLKIII